MHRSVTLVTFDCTAEEEVSLIEIYSQTPSQSVLIKTLSGIDALTIDHPE